LQSGLSKEVSLGVLLYLKNKVRGGCALSGTDKQKPHVDFFYKNVQVANFIPIKVSTLYVVNLKVCSG
jgi:hypothetical protein